MPSRRKSHRKVHKKNARKSHKKSHRKFLNLRSLLSFMTNPQSKQMLSALGVDESINKLVPDLIALAQSAPETINVLKLIVTQHTRDIPDLLEMLKLYSNNLAAKKIISMMVKNPNGIYKMADTLSSAPESQNQPQSSFLQGLSNNILGTK
jgi:hypothetical protein